VSEPDPVAWEWPKDQTLTYKVTPADPRGNFAASAIAKQLLAISRLLEATEDGLRWKVMLLGISTSEEDGSISFKLGIAPKTSALPPADRAPTETMEKTNGNI
jgi:hypothetical protein